MMAQVFNEFFVAKFVELLYGKSELVRTQFLKEGTQIFLCSLQILCTVRRASHPQILCGSVDRTSEYKIETGWSLIPSGRYIILFAMPATSLELFFLRKNFVDL